MGDDLMSHPPLLESSDSPAQLAKWLNAFTRNKAAALGGLIFLAFILAAPFAPTLAPYDPTEQNLYERLKPPMWVGESKKMYILGSDHLGRDQLSRLIFGTRVSLLVGVVATALSGLVGVLFGGLGGYLGGRTDEWIMGLADIQLAFPSILLALIAVAILGAGLLNVILVFSVTSWVPYARTLRASILSVREQTYVLASEALGSRRFKIFSAHILPNAVLPLIVIASFQMATLITQEAALSFLGVGVPPSVPSWGNMMADGREYLQSAWWLSTLPGLALMVVVLGINFLGDGLRNAIDPLMRS
jgi:peptide/nickel transport system permease protein